MKEVQIKEFNSPDFIYIPYDKTIKKSIGDIICCEEIIGIKDKKDYIYSPVSGIILKEEDGNLVIENDFKEKRRITFPSYKSLYNLKKEELLTFLKTYNIELPDIINLRVYYKKNINSDGILFNENIEDILELLDVFNISLKKEINIYIKKSDKITLHALQSYIEMYPNIKIIYNNKKDKEYISVFNIYKIYLILKSRRFPTSKYITVITKDKIYNLKTKIYVKVSDLLKYLNITDSKNIELIMDNKNIENYNGTICEDSIGLIVK